MDDVLGYCRYSANPVGRLVLYACGEVSPTEEFPPLRRDLLRAAARQFLAGCARRLRQRPRLSSAGRHAPLRRERRDHRGGHRHAGVPRPAALRSRLRALALRRRACRSSAASTATWRSISISSAAAAWRFCAPSSAATTTCSARGPPSPNAPNSRWRCAHWAARRCHFCASGSAIDRKALRDPDGFIATTLARAYATCRAIAKREAKNFYYAFVALPLERRNAICAIYAFMRQADDLADDESLPREERRRRLDAWLAAWHRGRQRRRRPPIPSSSPCATPPSASPFRFSCSTSWSPASPWISITRPPARPTPTRPSPISTAIATWSRRSWAWSASASLATAVERAEKLAEETGIAFQLTNILRDVSEDAARNRVYLPLDDLAAHGVSLDSLLHRAPSAPPTRGRARPARFHRQARRRVLPLRR